MECTIYIYIFSLRSSCSSHLVNITTGIDSIYSRNLRVLVVSSQLSRENSPPLRERARLLLNSAVNQNTRSASFNWKQSRTIQVSSNLIKFPANRSISRSCFRDKRESKITLVSDFCVSIRPIYQSNNLYIIFVKLERFHFNFVALHELEILSLARNVII